MTSTLQTDQGTITKKTTYRIPEFRDSGLLRRVTALTLPEAIEASHLGTLPQVNSQSSTIFGDELKGCALANEFWFDYTLLKDNGVSEETVEQFLIKPFLKERHHTRREIVFLIMPSVWDRASICHSCNDFVVIMQRLWHLLGEHIVWIEIDPHNHDECLLQANQARQTIGAV